MIPNAVYVDGKVAVVYHQPIPKYLRVGNVEIVFNCQHGISLAFAPEEQVPAILAHLGGCCGQRKNVVSLASEVLYTHWLSGTGGR